MISQRLGQQTNTVDFVVGADVVYDYVTARLMAPLLESILRLSPTTTVILCLNPSRNEGAFSYFMSSLSAASLSVEEIEVGFLQWEEGYMGQLFEIRFHVPISAQGSFST
jgi:hypothetical protein